MKVHLTGHIVDGPYMMSTPACGLFDPNNDLTTTPYIQHVTCGRCKRVKNPVKVLRPPQAKENEK